MLRPVHRITLLIVGIGSASQAAGEPLALLTSYSGEVTIERNGGEIAARPLLPLREGDVVQLQEKAGATVVCRTDRAVDLARSERLSHELCAQGTELPAGSYAVVEPRGGRIQRVDGSFEPAPATRELPGDYAAFPVVLSPRNTALVDVRPTVRWTETPGAVDYQIQWSGPGFPAFAKGRDELRCRQEELFDGPVTTCELDWPLDAPQLQEGGVYYLSVGAWLKAELQPRMAEDANQVRILDAQRADELRLVIDRTRSLPSLDKVTRQTFLAGFHLQDEVYVEAITAYQQAVELQPSAKIYATLGDLYRSIELYRYAAESYRQALRLAAEDVDRAAAEFGLGQVSYAWQRFQGAWEHFQRASAIYDRIDPAELADEKEAAAKMADLAQRRMRR